MTNENAALLTADLLKITRAIIERKGTLGRLLNDTAMAKNLDESIENLKYVSDKATLSIDRLNKILKSTDDKENVVGVLFKDTVSGAKLKHVINDLQSSGKTWTLC